MGSRYWIDVYRCFIGNELNHDHLLDIFCVYSGTNPATLRSRILDVMEEEALLWETVGRVVLTMKMTTLSDWIAHMRQPTSQCDEFMLLILCRIHCRHVLFTHRNDHGPVLTVN